MSEPKTFYGEWIPWGDRYRIDRPRWSLWLVELRTGTLTEAVHTNGEWLESDGRSLDDVGPKRLRRVYPPGSVLPEPRDIIVDGKLRTLGDHLFWMVSEVTAPGSTPEPWVLRSASAIRHWATMHRVLSMYVGGQCYPVQAIANGAFVPVPWSAVGKPE